MADYTGGGFIMIQRTFQNTRAYRDPDATLVYTHCQMRANICPVNVRGIQLKRGQFLTTMDDFGNECGMNTSKMRRVLQMLENDGLITKESAEKATEKPAKKATGKPTKKTTEKPAKKATKTGTIITVVNYGFSEVENGKSDGENDGETGEESDRQTGEENDGETGNSIIIKNKEKKNEKKEFNEDSRYMDGTEPEGVPPSASVLSSNDSNKTNKNHVRNEAAIRLAEEFTKQGFRYSGNGGGGFPGYLANILIKGFTEKDLRTALGRLCDASKGTRIRDHVAYMNTVLSSMYENGECENGFFLSDGAAMEPDWLSEEIVDYFIDNGIDQFNTLAMKTAIEKLMETLDEDQLWDVAETFVNAVKSDPDRIRDMPTYFLGLAKQMKPYVFEFA